ncbi:transcriptional regulator [Streptomyces mashuensis]|uniref:Transcriptional regulator n=1 Tax=Streptomyces mashuensis TaxID=33904 RepID=A0A919B8A5_9ACTN|nr:helix-turn-helix transcriptional regulator [Streptomyces mashuensis]GHF70781.1 transcriptional regulator [Streptomyces mashuensis]
MKKNGHDERGPVPRGVAPVPYRPAPGAPPGIEVLTLARLAERAAAHGDDLHRPSRPAFHLLIVVRVGTVRCSVDFTTHDVTSGDWLWVRPGQVVRFCSAAEGAEGAVVVFPSGFLSGSTVALSGADDHTRCRSITPSPAHAAFLDRVLGALEDGYAAPPAGMPPAAHIEAMRHLLSALLVRLAHAEPSPAPAATENEAFRRFQGEVEKSFARTRRVEDYAALLGYSPRTLTRATRSAAGCGAKQFIDDRVLLEAKRLLVHTTLSPSAVGDRTGFDHATAFSAFFRRHTGLTPTAFRRRAVGDGGEAGASRPAG